MRKTKVTFHHEKLRVSSELMRALAHPLRLRILAFIDRHGTINVNKIYGALKIEQSITSQHLRILRNAGVLHAERDGKYIHYTIDYAIVSRVARAVQNFIGRTQ
ncbi:MAG TPA: metalloregulator ArsR/SmtB family transcription factor [Saprospiraceae bacterium]|nr:metalloregulator ArsR/SmtB family transcription factor [Saprospiraceae bacterium]